ncbi:4-hydroxy-3-methylbut-2-enyl diphosphate reductase [Thermosynechococcus sp. QKsg1]|uniref:4-hydroxy-3-methylbut-2-enyl diphosphate reductase n=1 Tax=unclassified Thermosynechococcus TaxID=2622553 RepID=UPI00257844C3|nr:MULTISPECIES: 4-hydroxy-3-methylbut-2-enyl diphosphate reductase [unclassified Thermosynechococcus]WJI23808.1 4-hydroxy-3-methylbut-2-enyl diphosphate reductase [Thermosynechococcus sp. B0]WJI26322.1 4-hydroxy-3-methylbut-2-enyl diphosphate reductase [Thermosynechococcus sp. B1]WJI28848.1 4-hydroxy-3-methylbut-2-enyl diphosphate reductase [Thermosynechococcus sp. B3]WKT83442.1 4-hydroxy-3-methylbut-2-enyl diphosphate reductase [Thermosynechococcus sp. HY596]WNC62573.1 4-hydroxy-3-methylbut-
MDTRAFKRSLHSSENYHRKGFGHGEEVNQQLQGEYQSSLIQQIRANGYRWQEGDVTIRLAEAFGFCWGVERAVALAYETRTHFPTERIWITNEIIHNPSVNERLRQMAVEFIPVVNGAKDFSEVRQGDVVILPAFGASVQEMQLLNERGCTIVDTTCPWVSKVWHSVEKHKKVSFTSIIHGKYNHEETIATSSFAGTYLIVLNLEEARYVCDYILKGGDREAFMAKFAKACSAGFDPDRDLVRVGIANQTTMLKGETEQIGKLFERTMIQKYGPDRLNEHFMSFNTICDATQERQDAMLNLVKEPLDLMVVIGGYNSSNTTHLQEIAIEHGIPSYHIDSADRIGPGNRIEHKPLHHALTVTENWLPDRPITIGITSGASTPDKVVEAVLNKIFALRSVVAVS